MDKLISSAEAFRVLSEYYHHRTPQQAEALLDALQRVPEAVIECENCPSLGINKFYPECIFTLDRGLKLVKTGVIVRCKDCVFFESGIRCTLRNEQTGYNDYCSKGRRIDG